MKGELLAVISFPEKLKKRFSNLLYGREYLLFKKCVNNPVLRIEEVYPDPDFFYIPDPVGKKRGRGKNLLSYRYRTFFVAINFSFYTIKILFDF